MELRESRARVCFLTRSILFQEEESGKQFQLGKENRTGETNRGEPTISEL
jgi:hypothetical protein